MNDSIKNVSGNEAAVLGALAGGAEFMFGYPITPATEILQGWIQKCQSDASLSYLQTEDETSAGFGVIGALLAGKKAFTATAGPGTVFRHRTSRGSRGVLDHGQPDQSHLAQAGGDLPDHPGHPADFRQARLGPHRTAHG